MKCCVLMLTDYCCCLAMAHDGDRGTSLQCWHLVTALSTGCIQHTDSIITSSSLSTGCTPHTDIIITSSSLLSLQVAKLSLTGHAQHHVRPSYQNNTHGVYVHNVCYVKILTYSEKTLQKWKLALSH